MDSTQVYNETEDAVSACMKRLGWIYVPNHSALVYEPLDYVGARQFRETYGYGEFFRGPVPDKSTFDGENIAYRATLSDSELAAYRHDLEGPGEALTDTVDTTSCRAKAGVEIRKRSGAVSPQLIDVVAFDRQLVGDTGYHKGLQSWSKCMTEQGYKFAAPYEAQGSFTVRTEAVHQRLSDRAHPGDADFDKEVREEIKVALLDLDCQVKFLLPAKRAASDRILKQIVPGYEGETNTP